LQLQENKDETRVERLKAAVDEYDGTSRDTTEEKLVQSRTSKGEANFKLI